MTCTPIPCTMHGANAWCKGNITHKRTNTQKCIKTKEMLQKHTKKFKGTKHKGVQKNHGNKTRRITRGPQHGKGSLKMGPTPHKQDREHNKTRHTPHNLCDGSPPSPIRPRTPRRSTHPSPLVENPVDNSSNPDHNVTVVMWKTPKPVENPVDNLDSLWITLWKTMQEHDEYHSI